MSSDECEFRGRGKRRDKDDSSSTSSVSSEEEFVDCPCGMTDVEKRFMLECPSCRMWQHANCVNVWDPFSPILDSYACARCVKSEALIYKVRACAAGVPFLYLLATLHAVYNNVLLIADIDAARSLRGTVPVCRN